MRIHQLVPSMTSGDATSNHILEINKRLKKWGFETNIFTQHVTPELKKHVRPLPEIRPFLSQPDDILIYHYGIFHYSAYLYLTSQCKRVLIYHNITPEQLYARWDKYNQNSCRMGRLLLKQLKQTDLAIGVSNFNRQELVDVGFNAAKTAVVPIFLPVDVWQTLPVDAALQTTLCHQDKINWLSVGRLAPNKALEDIIRLFHVYKNQINPQAHLYLVGSQSIKLYVAALKELVAALDLSAHVSFPGRVSDQQLKTYYQNSHLFISASQHEGFCVPLIESMFFGLPILARKATAVPETLGQAGILFNQLGHLEVAQTAHLMLTDPALRQQIIATQQQRLQAFLPEAVETRLQDALRQIGIAQN
jgi:L-malate glycosyltransferase